MKKLILLISIIGIIILILLSFKDPGIQKISDITINDLNKKVKISGFVSEILINEDNFVVFKFSNDTSSINVVCDCGNIKKNQSLIIIGKITKYENEFQIQADKILSK